MSDKFPEQSRRAYPPSPCTGVCDLNGSDVCRGCLRTLDEIVTWSGMTPAEQRRVLQDLAGRR